MKKLNLIFASQEELPLTPVIVAAPTTAELDANLAVEELYSKYRKLQQQLEFLEVQVTNDRYLMTKGLIRIAWVFRFSHHFFSTCLG